jgi:hypothetical protein
MRKRASSSFTFLSLTSIMISIGLVLNIAIIYASFGIHFTLAQPQQQNKQQQQISLTAVLEDQGDPARWKSLLQPCHAGIESSTSKCEYQLKLHNISV